MTAASLSDCAVVDSGQEANRPRTATNGRGHDTEVGASMPDKLTSAQRRVLDFLLADESGDFIIVPFSVTRDIRPIDALLELHLIEMEWRPVPNPPGSYDAHYRAVRP